MSANSSVSLTSLDYDSIKNQLKVYLREQTQFKDYDFEASNMSVILDIMAYNSYQQSFMLNMIANEMFLDSASLRDTVISHAKELNYLPKSFNSSSATVDIVINSDDPTLKSIVIPKGTTFITRMLNDTYTFSTDKNITITSGNGTFIASNVSIYEGTYLSDSYTINNDNPVRYEITNKRVDIESISAIVIEDNGSKSTSFKRATSLFGIDETSEVFFLQPTFNDKYEVIFGDGVVGRTPKHNSILICEYRISSGELPNGATTFISTGKINGQANVTINTVSSASGGSVPEDIESIKYNAPRAFTTQNRAVIAEDYENLLKQNFSEINAVSAYGGEDVIPPQYGKVFVSVDLKDVDGLPQIKKDQYSKFLKTKSFISMDTIFVSPEYTYLDITSTVKYNINITKFNPEDIVTKVMSSILEYSQKNLNNFNKTLRYSKMTNFIDISDNSIISNETNIRLIKYINPQINVSQNINIDFKIPLLDSIPFKNDEYPIGDINGIYSTYFTFDGNNKCFIEDDGDGLLYIVYNSGDVRKKLLHVGYVNYLTGLVQLTNFKISSYDGQALKIYANPKNKDISSSQNTILNIIEPDIKITVEAIRE